MKTEVVPADPPTDLIVSVLELSGDIGYFQQAVIDAVRAGRPLPATAEAVMRHADDAINDAVEELADMAEQGMIPYRPSVRSPLGAFSQALCCRIAALGAGPAEPGTAEYERLCALLNRLSAEVAAHSGVAPTDRGRLYTHPPEQTPGEIDAKPARLLAQGMSNP